MKVSDIILKDKNKIMGDFISLYAFNYMHSKLISLLRNEHLHSLLSSLDTDIKLWFQRLSKFSDPSSELGQQLLVILYFSSCFSTQLTMTI